MARINGKIAADLDRLRETQEEVHAAAEEVAAAFRKLALKKKKLNGKSTPAS